MPAVKQIFWLRNCVVSIELKKACRADGPGPSAAGTVLATGQEGCDPVSAPWSLAACTQQE